MKVMFASLGAYGHLYPMMPLALACADAGHEVVIATGEPFLGRLPLRTIEGYPPRLRLDEAIRETRRRHPEAHGEDFTSAMFAEVTAGIAAPTMIEQCERLRPDLVVFEGMHTGAGVAASVLGIPAVAFSIALTTAFYRSLHAATVEHQGRFWSESSRTPPTDGLLAAAVLNPAPPALQQEPAWAPVIPIRSVAYNDADAGAPAWLDRKGDRPRIYLTLGTVSFVAVQAMTDAIAEIAPLDVDVLAAVGPDGDPEALGRVPGNVRVERFVAQSAVLPLVDLIVHHGGTGTVLGALASGLPHVLLPQHADQFFNADLLTSVGAARAVTGKRRPGEIRRAVEAMLGECPERTRAAQLAEEIAAMPAPSDVVGSLVGLAAAAQR